MLGKFCRRIHKQLKIKDASFDGWKGEKEDLPFNVTTPAPLCIQLSRRRVKLVDPATQA
jgi:hypothetical protein